MESGFKTNLLIGALAAGVLGAGGYGLYRESRRPAAPGAPRPLPVPEAPAGEGESPWPWAPVRIETLPLVAAGSAGHEARAAGGEGFRCEWTIKGGTLESAPDRDTVLWTAGPSGAVILACRVTDGSGASRLAAVRVPIRTTPGISLFEAAPPVLTQGESARLGWTAKDCRRLVLDPGARDVTGLGGPGLEVSPAETATYRLTATDDAGAVTTRELTLRVVPPPQILSLRAEPRAEAPGSFTVVGEFKGGRAELKEGDAVRASSDASPLRAELSGLKPGASLSLVVTNEAGTAVTGTVQFSLRQP